jgi:SAM-dependent methyltransferase
MRARIGWESALAIRGSTKSSDERAMTADLNPSAYDAFAPFYDAFTAQSDYEKWSEEMVALAVRNGLAGDRMLDLACGTGNSFLPFLHRGFRVTACDASAGMLALAAAKAPEVELVQCDIRALPELGGFDLVTCFDDSLNHLLGDGELTSAFAGMEAALAPGGLALFDLNSLLAYRTTFARQSVSESGDALFAWRGSAAPDAPPGCEVEAVLDVFAHFDGGLWSRVTTTHRQRHFPRASVVASLHAAGLECVSVHGVLPDCSLVEPADEAVHPKVVYTATRARGGDAQ